MTTAEMQLRREKNLCFTCDEKFSPTRRCPNRQYFILQYEEDANFDKLPDPPDDTSLADNPQILDHHLPYNALNGSFGLGTMKFTGTINELEVQVLLDSGSSDNFLQPRLAHCLKLPIEPVPNFQVLVGNGNSLTAEGMVKALQVQIQGNLLNLPVYLLPVSGADLVLGAAWLATLGPHISDYSNLTLKFYLDGKFITLHGANDPLTREAQFHHLKRFSHTQSIAQLFTLQVEKPVVPQDHWMDLPDNMEPELILLLHTYKEVFDVPTGLPPERVHNHAIPLIEGAPPVKVRPYRYPHSQKHQIELMISDMLNEGIIAPSTSPFSSPVILVKKKDGSWRFCTDYRALNAITMKDSFPIPTVDELIDELFGAQFFSKLDLRSGYHQILVKDEDRYKTAFRTHHCYAIWTEKCTSHLPVSNE